MNDETLEQIQTKIAFLERASVELSDVMFRQQQEIQVLGEQLRTLAERLRGVVSEQANPTAEEERPPHY